MAWRARVFQLLPQGIYGSTDFTLCRVAHWERFCARIVICIMAAVSGLGFPIKVFLVSPGSIAVIF